jgi:hypothetical protein
MTRTEQEFKQRMRFDRAFRQRVLAARKDGALAKIFEQEGFEFDLSLLVTQLPRVRTGILAGTDDTTTACYCLI